MRASHWPAQVGDSRSQNDASISIGKFAPKLLHRRVKKIVKAGRDLKALSVRQRHKFRIKIKKIRYAAEFFESLFPAKHDRKQLARLSGRLKKIQDALGALNDYIAHQKLAADVALKTSTQIDAPVLSRPVSLLDARMRLSSR